MARVAARVKVNVLSSYNLASTGICIERRLYLATTLVRDHQSGIQEPDTLGGQPVTVIATHPPLR